MSTSALVAARPERADSEVAGASPSKPDANAGTTTPDLPDGAKNSDDGKITPSTSAPKLINHSANSSELAKPLPRFKRLQTSSSHLAAVWRLALEDTRLWTVAFAHTAAAFAHRAATLTPWAGALALAA